MAHDQRVMASGISETDEKQLTAGGVKRTYLASKAPYRDGQGNIIGVIGICHDITERKRTEDALRSNEQRWRSLTEALPQLVWSATPDGANEYFSTQWTHYTGLAEFETVGWRWLQALHPDDREPTRQLWLKSVAGHQPYDVEYRVRGRDGAYRWFKTRGVPIRDSGGNTVKWLGTCTDITDLRQTQESLRERERQFDSLMGHLPGLAYRALADEHWTALFASKGVEDLTGYPPDEFTSRRLNYADIMLPEDLPATRRAVIDALRERRMYEVEHRIRHKDSSIRWIWARGHGVFAPDGSLRFIEGLNLDMTRQKQAEEALRESEERFRGTFENAAVGIAHVHATGQLLRVNETCCAILGYSREELLGKTIMDLTHPDDLATTAELFAGLLRSDSRGYTIEKRYRRKDGSPIWTEVFVSLQRDAAGEPAYAIGVIQDVSERKRLEEEVRLASARLELALRGSSIGFWDIDMPDGDLRNGRVHYVNVWEQLGYERPDSSKDQETGMALVHPDDRAAHAEAARRYLAGETSEFEVESRLCHKDGSLRWMISRGVAVRDAGGNPIRFLGTGINITDRKRAEEALRESEERFRGTFENAAVGIVHSDSAGHFLRVNEKFCAIIGYSREELLHKVFRDIVHPDELNAHIENYKSTFVRNAPLAFGVERRFLRKDGTTVWLEGYVSFQYDASGRPLYAIAAVLDISERKMLDEELRRAKESAEAANRAKDEFLANVSHEIRTPMNAILGMAELTLDTPLTDEQRSNLNIVLSSAEGLLNLINDLLDFSKIEAGRLELEEVDFSLRTVLNQTLRALALRRTRRAWNWHARWNKTCPTASSAMAIVFARSCSTSLVMRSNLPTRVRSSSACGRGKRMTRPS